MSGQGRTASCGGRGFHQGGRGHALAAAQAVQAEAITTTVEVTTRMTTRLR